MSAPVHFDIATSPVPPGTTLIEASAGTGKTFAIAGLFVRLVLEGLAPREILVTTFTEAATAELRDRIRRRLRDAVEVFAGKAEAPLPFLAQLFEQHCAHLDESRKRLEAALRSFDEATISTIHGFCHTALREHALESGELFDAELLTDDATLRRELAEDFWRGTFYPAAPFLPSLARAGGLSPGALAEIISETARQPLAEVLPPPDAGALTALVAAWEKLRAGWERWQPEVRAIFAGPCEWANKPYNRPDEIVPVIDAAHRALTDEVPSPDSLNALPRFTTSALAAGSAKRGPGAPPHEFFDACDEFEAARVQWLSTLRSECAAWGRREGDRRKRERNLLSFDDLLTRLHSALASANGDALAERLRARFKAALIDEFQDTDQLQAEIFEQVFAGTESRLVLIGDPKQAIYAFRGADVFSYLRASARASRRYELPANHRSEDALVRAVNHLFTGHARPFLIEDIHFHAVEPQGRAEQTPLRIDGQRPAPLRFWWAEGEDGDFKAGVLDEMLPGTVAAEIARLLASGATLGERALQPSDFAVLVRANKDAAPMRDALTTLGIPAVVHSGESVFASAEAGQLRDALAAIAEPTREPLVRAALACDLFALDAAELHRLEGDAAAWEERLRLFQRAHDRWQQRGFMPMFRALLQEIDLRRRLLARPGGERALTNQLHLAELVHQAASESRLGIEGVLTWYGRQCQGEGGLPPEYELRLERDEAAVQILTLHKSKGLEFGIVFCPHLWRASDQGTKKPLRCHRDDRLVLDFGSEEEATHAALASDEGLAEELRVLYVALTRARHQCVVVWGKCDRHSPSAPAWLLHTREGVENRAALEARMKPRTAAEMKAELETLAAGSGGAIIVEPLPAAEAPALSPTETAPTALTPREFTTIIDRTWQVSSFSGLTSHRDEEAPDYDGAAAPVIEPGTLAGIHAFPRGRKAGTCLHEIFEEIDFTGDALDPIVARKLGGFGLGADHTATVVETVRRALDADLGGGARLRGLAKEKRLSELEFVLRAADFSAEQLTSALGPGIGRLVFEPRRGLVKGFIDLVAEIDGRYFIVDWKSNWLGASEEDYDPEALREAMRASRYGLQYHLYALALHRHLTARRPDYRYDAHFGGAAYLFLRGLDPARPDLGVFRDRPDLATLTALDRLFTP